MGVITYTAASTAHIAKTRWNRTQCWGGGGTGGPATGATDSRAGGGAGGQCSIKQVALAAGTSTTMTVAQTKTSLTSSVLAGDDSTFGAAVTAKGGAGGLEATGATSTGGVGSTTGGVGDTVYAGGSGGDGVASTVTGGGGGGAGNTGTGNAGSGGTAGVAKADNGGAGGTGVSTANTRNAGSVYGGGGSGGMATGAADRRGGDGAAGLGIVDWIPPCSMMLLGVG